MQNTKEVMKTLIECDAALAAVREHRNVLHPYDLHAWIPSKPLYDLKTSREAIGCE